MENTKELIYICYLEGGLTFMVNSEEAKIINNGIDSNKRIIHLENNNQTINLFKLLYMRSYSKPEIDLAIKSMQKPKMQEIKKSSAYI